jgi:hypothetical protein
MAEVGGSTAAMLQQLQRQDEILKTVAIHKRRDFLKDHYDKTMTSGFLAAEMTGEPEGGLKEISKSQFWNACKCGDVETVG